MLQQTAYMSASARRWSRPELLGLLREARSHNGAYDITGVLLFRHGRFLQLLEGEGTHVESLFASIQRDARHRDVTRIWEVAGATRWFSGWAMGFRDLEDDPISEPGLIDILRGPPDASVFGHDVVVQLWRLLRRSDAPS